MTTHLFKPLELSGLSLKNRIVMAPLTRGRAGAERVPSALMKEYYQQRAQAGLIIAEATVVSAQGIGFLNSPGIYNDAMERGWRDIAAGVLQAGSHLFLQLWHCGRASHSDFHQGELPVSASPIPIRGGGVNTPMGKRDYETPRALTLPEIKKVIQDYGQAAKRAAHAGIEGVEIHAANGYLINQFLDTKCNQRSDEYGGSLENRSRFLMEVIKEVANYYSENRISVRLSPNGVFNDMGCSDYRELYDYVIAKLNSFKLAYLHIMDGLGFGFHKQGDPYTLKDVRKIYRGVVMGNCGYTADSAELAISEGHADLIAFGRPFITNPNLPEKIQKKIPLNPSDDRTYWYTEGAKGYTDYN